MEELEKGSLVILAGNTTGARPDRSGVTNIENVDEREGLNASEFLLASMKKALDRSCFTLLFEERCDVSATLDSIVVSLIQKLPSRMFQCLFTISIIFIVIPLFSFFSL